MQIDPANVLDPDDDFERLLLEAVKTHRAKRADYAGDDHPNQNFYDTAYQLSNTAGHSVETLIATKQARLRILLPRLWKDATATPSNESIRDSLLDRFVYSGIALGIFDEGGYTS